MADLHLAPVPGTDLALLNGMLHLIIETGKVDQDFIVARTSGFEAAKANALSHHPARVEQITGVSESQMRLAVDWLGDDRPAMVLSGRGPEQQSKGVATVLACANLVLALGKSGKPGSGYGCLTGQANGQGGVNMVKKRTSSLAIDRSPIQLIDPTSLRSGELPQRICPPRD